MICNDGNFYRRCVAASSPRHASVIFDRAKSFDPPAKFISIVADIGNKGIPCIDFFASPRSCLPARWPSRPRTRLSVPSHLLLPRQRSPAGGTTRSSCAPGRTSDGPASIPKQRCRRCAASLRAAYRQKTGDGQFCAGQSQHFHRQRCVSR